MTMPITHFTGPHAYLSNFFPIEILFAGHRFPSSEHAYQAQKTLNKKAQEPFFVRTPKKKNEMLVYDDKKPHYKTAAEAKVWGSRLILRPDWEVVKFDIMTEVVRAKFAQHAPLAAKLLETGGVELVEGNGHGDRVWGVCRGVGENRLGKILMQIREELRAKTV